MAAHGYSCLKGSHNGVVEDLQRCLGELGEVTECVCAPLRGGDTHSSGAYPGVLGAPRRV